MAPLPPKIADASSEGSQPLRLEIVEEPKTSSGPPIHALSALILVAVDNLWNLAEWAVVDWIVTIPLSFVTVFVPVFLIQKALKRDSNARALAFAILLGVLAAIPTSITGTPVGLGLLAWTGLGRLFGKSSAK